MSQIVMTTIGSLGDIHPMIAIARELRRRGHKIVFATCREYQDKIEVLGFEFRRMRPDGDNGLDDPDELARRGMDLKTGTEYVIRNWVVANLRETYEDLLNVARDADLIIAGELVYAAQLVAEKLNKRWILVVLQPTSLFSIYDPPVIPIFPFAQKISKSGSAINWGIIRLLKTVTGSWIKPVYQLRQELDLSQNVKHPLFDGKYSPYLTLAMFSSVLAKPQPDWAENIVVTGFCFYDGSHNIALTPELKQFLDAGEPPIVFTLGSAAVNSPGDFYPESIKAAKILNRRAVLLIGKNPVPAELTKDIIAVDYAPYSAIFPHARAIVHQGGIGTTAQAMRAGCPTLIAPYSHDQPDNAARVECLGTSRTITRQRYSAKLVAKELKELLNNLEYQTQAMKIARKIRTEDGVKFACDAIIRQLKI